MTGRTKGSAPQATDGTDRQAGDDSPGTTTGGRFALVPLAHAYLDARRTQRLYHTDEALNWRRTEAHDQFMLALDAAGIGYKDREHAAEIAEAMDELVEFATAFVEAEDRADAAWLAWVFAVIQEHSIEVNYGRTSGLRRWASRLKQEAEQP